MKIKAVVLSFSHFHSLFRRVSLLIIAKMIILLTASLCYSATDWCYEYVERKEYDKAIDECTKKIGSSSNNENLAFYFNNRGRAYKGKGQLDQAITDYNKAIELNPRYYWPYYNRGIVYKGKGQLDQAITDYNKAIQLNPQFVEAYNNRGNVYADKKQYDRAIKDYNKAIELSPEFYNAYYNRGIVYTDEKQYDRAIKDYDKAIELNPRHTNSYYSKACIYSLTNNSTEACRWLKKAIEKGYDDWNYIKSDNDFDNIRNSSCYREIMSGR